jgi:hypothetical protein
MSHSNQCNKLFEKCRYVCSVRGPPSAVRGSPSAVRGPPFIRPLFIYTHFVFLVTTVDFTVYK